MLHPSWRTALRRLAAKLASPSRRRKIATLSHDNRLEERLAPALMLRSQYAMLASAPAPTPVPAPAPAPAPTLRAQDVAPPTLVAPPMPGLSTLDPVIAGAVERAWEVPTTTTTAEWVVAVTPGQDPQTVFGPGFTYTATGILPDTYVAKSTSPQLVSEAASKFAGATYFYPLIARQHSVRLIPNDPLFSDQWHLRNVGQTGGLVGADVKVTQAWNNFNGKGVLIAVVDDGFQHEHPDLSPNYKPAHSFDFNDNDSDPSSANDDHGTAVGGVAAGKGNNGIGVAGAAFNADLAGIRLIAGGVTDQTEANALSYHRDAIDIYNNSWGPADNATLGSIGPLALAALQQSVAQGRDGLGNIYTWAAGNGLGSDDNVNYDAYANSRYVIAVGAINHNGKQASYSEPGAAMLVTAHSNSNASPGITTTDNLGQDGYDASDYTDTFGGTSSASPLVAGVIGLILQANPNLGYRDVQHILVRTARKTDPTDAGWTKNKAGLNINHKYGFGAVDATAAVNLAQAWVNVKPEMKITGPLTTVGKAIPDNGTAVTSSVSIAQNFKVEHVEVIFDATHQDASNLEVVLTAPSGTRSVLAEQHDIGSANFGNYSKWTFSSVRHWGETSAGKWTLSVRDLATGETGTFDNWQIQVYGTEGIPPALSNLESTQASVLENKAIKVTSSITVTDPNSPTMSGARVSISGNFQPGQDVLKFSTAGAISGSFDEGTGVLALSGTATRAQYQSALRSITYENTSDDPITSARIISFQVTDDTGTNSNIVARAISVIPVNDAPSFTAGGDVEVLEDAGPRSFPGWATDISPGPEAGQTVSFEIVTNDNPSLFLGDPFVTSTGTLTFQSAFNASGTANLTVRVRDSGGTAFGGVNESPAQPFKVTVLPVNDAPSANDDLYNVREDGTLTVPAPGVLGNDSDPEGNPLSATQVTDVGNGTLVFNANGSFTYTPDANFSGTDSFTYKANEFEFSSAPVTVTLNVAAVNDRPTANDDVAVTNGNPVTITVLANDTDADGDVLRVGSYTAPTLGRVTRSGNSLIYTPNPGAVGTDVFSYTVFDTAGASDTGSVSVSVTDAVAPEVQSVRVRYGSASPATMDFESLTRTVLPWSNITAFSFVFNEGVVPDAGALTLTGATGGPVTLNLTYDALTRTATWTAAAALGIDRYTLHLDASLVEDLAGNPLAADWAKSFAVLPGDFDGNGLVDDVDLAGIQANFTVLGRPVNRFADVNGSGFVDVNDLDAARLNLGRRI